MSQPPNRTWSPSLLMEWAKSGSTGGRFNLARSGIPPILSLDELPGGPFQPDLWGHNEWGHPKLRETIARMYGTKHEHVLIAQGTSQCNFLMAGAVLAEGGTAVVETPVYDPILRAVEVWADEVVRLPRRKENGYQPDPDELRERLDEHTRLIVLTNLHNPTQTALEPARLAAIVQSTAEVGALVMVDEVFLPMFAPDYRGHAFAFGAISASSLGKCWGLDALRVGWAVGPAEVVHRAYRLNNLLGVNQPYMTEDLACRLLNSPEAVSFMEKRRAQAVQGRALFDKFLTSTPEVACVPPPAGICALLELPAGTDDQILADELLKQEDTVVFPGHFFECPGCIRVSFGGPAAQVEEGLNRLSRFVRSRV
ncbi:MAG: pyridoxal phosphate-dependent aminotransferase [bacterium]|nr:pyridoxal phosphate-dependent aminotransferase [bacterium]